VLNNALAVSCLLCKEASGGKHGKAAVLEFLGLHGEELLGILRGEAEGIEAKVTRDVVSTELSRGINGGVSRVDPTLLGTELLGSANGDDQSGPELSGDLGDVRDGGSTDLRIKEEARALNLLSDEEANGGKHGNTAVSKLGLTVALEESLIGLVGEAEGVEEANGFKSAGVGLVC